MTWLLLIAGGAVSGLLSALVLPLFHDLGGLLFPGVFFGAALAGSLWRVERPGSISAVTAILCWSIGAYLVAIAMPMIVGKSWVLLSFGSDDARSFSRPDDRFALTAAGATGAAIVCLGFLLILQPQVTTARLSIELSVCSFFGAALARAAPEAQIIGLPDNDWRAVMFVLWQAGIACLLGALSTLRAIRAQRVAAHDSSPL